MPDSALAFEVSAFGANEVARPGRERGEGDLVFLVRLLDSGGLEVLQDHLGKGLLFSVASARFRHTVNQFIVFIHPEHAVRREALDGERPGHADFLFVVVGLVVEVFKLGLGGDGGIDLLLAGNAGLPPVGVQLARATDRGPFGIGGSIVGVIVEHSNFDEFPCSPRPARLSQKISGLCVPRVLVARNLPLLPGLLERGVQRLAQRLQLRLPLVPDDIDLCVVGDGLEGDVRYALIDKALADVAAGGLARWRGAGDFGLLELAVATVGQ